MTNTSRKYSKNMTLRLISRWSGKKLLDGGSADQVGSSLHVVGSAQDHVGDDVSRDGTSLTVQSDTGAYADNNDVWRRRFVKRGMSRLRRNIRRVFRAINTLIAFIREFRNPKLSAEEKRIMSQRLRRWNPDELEAFRRQKQADGLFDFHKVQAKLIENRIIDVLTNLGFCFHVTKGERKFIKKRISVAHVDVSPYAYTYHLVKMPFGVRVTEIAQDWVSTELAASIGKKVRYDLDLEGLRFTVEVGSTLSIPNFVGFGDLDDKHPMPKNLPPLSFWAGLTSNGSPVYRNLAEAPHMIVAGSSGGGKSNMENAIACMFIRNNSPEIVRMVFFDLKGGVEFTHFENIPHLWPMSDKKNWSTTGIVEYPSDVIPALKILFDECMSRLGKLKKAKVKNINEYNRGKKSNRIPYIIVFFDEWASTKKLVGAEAETLLSNIANLSRSAGIHFILATQYPKAEIINTTISVNFPWRIAFNMGSGASQSVLGDWGAFGLSPVGRAVLQTMEGQIQIQTPRITNQNVIDVTEEARTGRKMTKNMENIDTSDILEWSIKNAGGKLDFDSLFNQFKGKITYAALLEMMKSMDNKIFDVQGTMYRVVQGIGNLPRRMEIAEESSIPAENSLRTTHYTEEIDEIEPEPVTHDEPVTLIEPLIHHTCEHCGAQTLSDPCEFCGQYIEEKNEV